MLKKISAVLMLFLFLSNCSFDTTYTNRYSRYRIKYPKDWIALVPNSRYSDKQMEFIKRLENESYIKNYNTADIAFFNPQSEPPIFDEITVTSIQKRIDYNRIEEYQKSLEKTFFEQLKFIFYDVKIVESKISDFKRGKIFIFEYSLTYAGKKYFVIYKILTGKIVGTYFFYGISKSDNWDYFMRTFNSVLNSFSKF
jgi:hypothetical protein